MRYFESCWTFLSTWTREDTCQTNLSAQSVLDILSVLGSTKCIEWFAVAIEKYDYD